MCQCDHSIVYCLTNDSSTVDSEKMPLAIKRKSLEINRPRVITRYNTYMGGVDIVDMQRLLTLQLNNHGLESIVVEAFFYLLDVGKLNALAQYNESFEAERCSSKNKMNILLTSSSSSLAFLLVEKLAVPMEGWKY